MTVQSWPMIYVSNHALHQLFKELWMFNLTRQKNRNSRQYAGVGREAITYLFLTENIMLPEYLHISNIANACEGEHSMKFIGSIYHVNGQEGFIDRDATAKIWWMSLNLETGKVFN